MALTIFLALTFISSKTWVYFAYEASFVTLKCPCQDFMKSICCSNENRTSEEISNT